MERNALWVPIAKGDGNGVRAAWGGSGEGRSGEGGRGIGQGGGDEVGGDRHHIQPEHSP